MMSLPADLATSGSDRPNPTALVAPVRTNTTLRNVLLGVWRVLVVQATFTWFVFTWLAGRVGLRWVFWWMTGRRAAYEPFTAPVALRKTFEALGPTYIKLGQFIASGDGLFPVRYSEEFRRCLDQVPSFSFAEVEQTVETELGHPLTEAFLEFEPEPIAAASIAQVHLAQRRDGERVVVKVQRPGIAALIRSDLSIMHFYARLLSWLPHVKLSNPVGIVEDLEKTLHEELDFRREAHNMDEFSAIMRHAENDRVVAPAVHWDQTTRRVLAMERFEGVRVDDQRRIADGPHDPVEVLLEGIRGWFQGLIYRGFFHGDVHAGNFMVLSDGRVGFLDFGIVGRFDEARRSQITEYVLAFQTRDFTRLAQVLVDMGSVSGRTVDMTAFTEDLERVFDPMVNPGEEFAMRQLVPGMLAAAVKHRMRMPRDFVLVTKQLVYLDRYAKAYGGPTMNVLTDPRVMQHILEDLARAATCPMAAAQPAT